MTLRHWSVALSFVGIVGGAWSQAASGDSTLPDPAKWNSEGVVRIFEQNANGLLSGIYRRGGFNDGAAGFTANNDLSLINPNEIQSMEATVTLLDAATSGEGFTVSPRAGLEGFFYWNGTGPGGSDRTGQVFAAISLQVDRATQTGQAFRILIRCNDPNCTTNTPIDNAVLAPVGFFERHRLRIAYDGANFTFQLDEGEPAVVAAPDANRLAVPVGFKALRTRLVIPASPTASARILALFEDLSVNGTPYENFEEKSLPRVSLLPGPGSFPSSETFDAVLVVESPEALAAARVTLNGATIFDLAALESSPLLVRGTLVSGGRTYRLPGFKPEILGPGPHLVGAEVTTVSGATARSFAVWQVLPVTE